MFLYVLEVFVPSLVEVLGAERTVDHLTSVTVVDPSTPGDVNVLIIELDPDLAAVSVGHQQDHLGLVDDLGKWETLHL